MQSGLLYGNKSVVSRRETLAREDVCDVDDRVLPASLRKCDLQENRELRFRLKGR